MPYVWPLGRRKPIRVLPLSAPGRQPVLGIPYADGECSEGSDVTADISLAVHHMTREIRDTWRAASNIGAERENISAEP
jgi:hypothetical protein